MFHHEFFRRLVTIAEIWFHHFIPDTKNLSNNAFELENRINKNTDMFQIKCLEMFHNTKDEFFRRCVTMEETWFQHFTPETKEQSKQRTRVGEQYPKKPKTF